MGFRFLPALAALLLVTAPALAQTPEIALPRTETIFVTPPEGYVVSVWQGGTIELGEFTPPDQTQNRYVDLMGYSVLPQLAGVTATRADELPAFERRNKAEGCAKSVIRERQLSPGWYSIQSLCVGRAKAADPEHVEITFTVNRVGRDSVFRVWRTWRGTPAELTGMLKARTGQTLAPVRGKAPRQQVDEAALDKTFAALAPLYQADLARTEICDLAAAQPCASLRAELAPWVRAGMKPGPWVAGFHAAGLGVMPREEFRLRTRRESKDDGTPNRIGVLLLPDELDWNDPEAVNGALQLVAIGQAADGGALVIADPDGKLDAGRRAQLRAHVVAAARRLWRPGMPPGVVTVAAPGS